MPKGEHWCCISCGWCLSIYLWSSIAAFIGIFFQPLWYPKLILGLNLGFIFILYLCYEFLSPTFSFLTYKKSAQKCEELMHKVFHQPVDIIMHVACYHNETYYTHDKNGSHAHT